MAVARGGTTSICNRLIGCSVERVGEFLPRPSRYPNLIPRAFFFVKLHSIKPIIENWSEDVNRIKEHNSDQTSHWAYHIYPPSSSAG
ncbi:hypothetical protein AVEN_137563-1 [Araneus ventricosus]|uniref:Uncharacterized protein n=1 Tax=Araneus ventricosus TaxID=182803 RepID=A0A4Y2S4P1_ARAVE|nr:hypothetical protein AVEN_137563-1 [Araneus ventricosus]